MKKILLFAILLCTFATSKAQYLFLLSPAGGETFAIGSSIPITWASLGINEIDIEYSSNNGTTFTTVGTNVSVFNTNYNWLVTGPATSTGIIKVKESGTGALTQISPPFNVVNPSIQITFPTISSVFNPGQQVNITWTGLIVSNNVTLLFSSNNGSTYDTIASNITNFYNYDWIVPSVSSTNCKIKIYDAASPSLQNSSATFTIEALPSSGTILNPNGGETLLSTTNYSINWTVAGTNIIDLEYTPDGGSSWITIAQSIAADTGTYSWTVPSLNSNNVKIRLINAINGLVLDASNNTFTISQPTPVLYLSSPFGYENWAIGSTQSIEWIFAYINTIKIEYSTDGGTNYTLIAANIPASDLSYNWIVPSGLSSNCIIRITDNNSATSSQNQNPFSIVTPSITLLTPNGGEIYNSNVDSIISWNGNTISNLIKIEYSINNGLSWNLVVNNLINTNFYHWHVPNTPSSACKVRVSDAQFPVVTDVTNQTFTITAPMPTITLLSPNGSEQWGIGTNQNIFWTTNNIANVKIEYSSDSGATWTLITALHPANTGFYNWFVDAVPSSNTLIKITDAATITVNDVSTSVFEVYTPVAFIDLLYPNGGEEIAAGLNSTITWNALGLGNIILEYSINNGINWQIIEAGVQSTLGAYIWDVPNLFTTNIKIRIRDEVNSSIYDQSAGNFSIIGPSLNFVGFPAGSSFTLLTNINLSWVSEGISSQTLKLEYSINNGLNWVTFASGVPNTGSYNWLINSPPTAACIFKISVENEPGVNDVTQGSINIISSGPAIVILTPTAFENLNSGSIYPITWNSYGINYVRIEYSLNGDTIYQLITALTPASTGLFNWTVPPNLNATNCNIKISNAANTNISTITPFFFNIQTGEFMMTSGNTNFILFAGSNYPITWTSTATSGYVTLEYTIDSLNWNTIVSNYSNSGNYNWTVPYINADSVWFKVKDQVNSNIFAINVLPQKIVIADSLVQLIYPLDGTQLLGGSSYTITWTSYGINFVDIEFSDNNGSTWNILATNIDANAGTYSWIVPSQITSNALIKIKNSINPLQFTQNQTAFSISNPTLNIISPNGGELWNTNSSYYIQWQSVGVNFINLYYSLDGGTTYNVIDTNLNNIGYYNWLTPAIPGSNIKIKIVDSNNQFFSDESNANFSLTNPATSIALISPNGTELLQANEGTYITWQSSGISTIDISLSLNGGTSYVPIASNIPSIPSFYYWLIPDTQTVACKIKINSSANTNINDASNSNFAIISDSLNLQLTFPNGGENFNSNSFQTIKWSALNTPFVKLYYSINGGITYTYINSVLNDTMFVWQVPNLNSSSCKIKIENGNNPSSFDVTNAIFTIVNQALSTNSIFIDSLPNTTLCSGASFSASFITIGSFTATNNFRVHLSDQNGNFNNFTDIGGIISDSSSTIQCTIPSQIINGTGYLIRIVADNPSTIGNNYTYGNITIDKANADFSSDKQLVLFPNTEVNFQPNSPINAISNSTWNTGNGGNYSSFNAQHIYNIAGKFDIFHTVTDTFGCTSTKTISRLIQVEHWFPNVTLNANSLEELVDIKFENPRFGCAILKNGNCVVSNDSGATWAISYTNSNGTQLNSISILNNAWFIACNNGAYLKSTNKGISWTQFTFNNNESLNDLIFITPSLAYTAGNNGKLLKYNGTNWLNQNTGTNYALNKIAVINNTNIVVGDNATILKQQNNQWTTIPAPVNVNLNSIVLKDSITGYIAGDNGFILKTVDAGLNWTVVLSGADVNFTSIIASGDSLWVAGNEGIIYASIDNATTWKRFSVGARENINAMTYINKKGFIAGKNGLLRTFNKTEFVPVINQIAEKKIKFDVTCFPNPSSDKVTIKYVNNTSTLMTIKISDLQGKTVYETNKNGGTSTSQFNVDLSSLQSGIYFLNVIIDGQQQTFKIIKTDLN